MMHRDPKAAWFAIDLARDSPGIRDLAEFVERQIDQESSRTQRAIVDVEAAFRRAREDAGAPPANSTRKRPL
jgi:hypothetical protein